jgi:hypothetical protein
MNSYIIKYNNNIIGVYNDLTISLDYIYSLVNSNIIQKTSNVIIYEYKINSCIVLQEYNIDLNYIIINKSIINYSKNNNLIFSENKYESDSSLEDTSLYNQEYNENDSDINTTEEEKQKKIKREFLQNQNKLAQEKINIIHNINLLKEEKKKYDEKINEYNYDLNLYNKFKEIKNKNESFIIPIIFEQKYNIFNILDNQNNLTFENFIKIYKPEKINTQYDQLFDENSSKDILETFSDDISETFSETFSNINNNDLLIATNQN